MNYCIEFYQTLSGIAFSKKWD